MIVVGQGVKEIDVVGEKFVSGTKIRVTPDQFNKMIRRKYYEKVTTYERNLGHCGKERNERADTAAKEAAKGERVRTAKWTSLSLSFCTYTMKSSHHIVHLLYSLFIILSPHSIIPSSFCLLIMLSPYYVVSSWYCPI